MRAPLLLVAALALLSGAPALAEGCVPTTSSPEIDTNPLGLPGHPLHGYVDFDLRCPEEGNGCPDLVMWIYFEDNGIPGLQRWDSLKDDTCEGAIPSDLNTTPG